MRVFCALIIVSLLIAACTSSPPYRAVTPGLDSFEAFEIPLRMNDQGVLFVSLEASAGPLELILDTGADQALLLFDSTQYERVGRQWKWNASGRLVRAPVLLIPDIQIGPLVYSCVRAPVEDLQLPPYMAVANGVLGRACLEGLTLDIDGPRGKLGVLPAGERPDDFERNRWLEVELLDMSNGPMIPMRLDDSAYTLRVVLDTGAIATGKDEPYGVVELPTDLEPLLEQERGLPVYQAESVRLGTEQFGPMRFYVKHHLQPPGTHGFLGNALYMNRRVIIEPVAQRVWIESIQSGRLTHAR